MTREPLEGPVSRRTALAGTALAAGAVLAACSTTTSDASAPAAGTTTTTKSGPLPEFAGPPPTTPGGTATATKPGAAPEKLPPATTPGTDPPFTLNDSSIPSLVVTKTSAIPVGGGVIFPKHGVVVTQPTAGKFECFSTSCTHLGCTLNKIAAGQIRCPCHGARFSITDGSVKAGPALRPLTKQPFMIEDGKIVLS
jgi:Rieske Fe-S protein